MESIMAVLVMGTVVFLGALISAGHERQRRAIVGIREQASLWALEDLRLKREHLARTVRVEDPLAWLNQAAGRAFGQDLDLRVLEVHDQPQALVCSSPSGRRAVVSPVAPGEIRRLKRTRRTRLARVGNPHPLLNLGRQVRPLEISLLNGGILFDLELPLAWKQLANADPGTGGKLFLYLDA